jgi:hypothetical protein
MDKRPKYRPRLTQEHREDMEVALAYSKQTMEEYMMERSGKVTMQEQAAQTTQLPACVDCGKKCSHKEVVVREGKTRCMNCDFKHELAK